MRFLLMSPDHEADLERLDGDPLVRELALALISKVITGRPPARR